MAEAMGRAGGKRRLAAAGRDARIRPMRARPKSPRTSRYEPPPAKTGLTPDELAFWRTRVVRQRYTAAARPGSENELFARIEHDGNWVYFPLGSQVPDRAAARASAIYGAYVSDGWNAVRRRHVRLFIWAICWFTEPLACTYATLFTRPGRTAVAAAGGTGKAVPVAIVEPVEEVRRGLADCLNRMQGYACVRAAGQATELTEAPGGAGPAPKLVLYNQHESDLPAADFHRRLQARWPGVVAVPFNIYGHSDELFMAISGMERGYFLRRRPPAQLLEPLAKFWLTGPAAQGPLRRHLQPYFQQLVAAEPEPGTAALTQREAEILVYLGAGHTNKTIASLLGISAWTVHTYVKSIFEKLGAHTRAEAVMRYPDPLNR